MILWRPNRVRAVPFYSDASHNDPERVILASGENMACFFMPLVAIAEYLHLSRIATATGFQRTIVPRSLQWFLRPSTSLRDVIICNFIVTISTTAFFFVTANVPSKRPLTPPHQFAASGLIFAYSIQSTLKAILATTFKNYNYSGLSQTSHHLTDKNGAKRASTICSVIGHTWEQHHMLIRITLTYSLWFSLVATWICYAGRVLAKKLALSNAQDIRSFFATSMAVVVYGATMSCVVLMVIMSVDMRNESIVIRSSLGQAHFPEDLPSCSPENATRARDEA